MSRFTGKTAVVTGGGGEIGRAVAERLAAEGARLLVVDVRQEGVDRTVDAILAAGGVARGWVADVTDPESVTAYAQAGADLGEGRIDLFFNNAGVEGDVARIEDHSLEAFDRVMAVNVRGVFLGLKYVLPRMEAGGVVVNTASVAGLKATIGGVAYAASKHAVLGITKTAALEAAGRGIRVAAIAPGAVEGRMMASLVAQRTPLMPPGVVAHDPSATPFGRYASLDEVAGAVAFLFSADAGFVSGSPLIVDGAGSLR